MQTVVAQRAPSRIERRAADATQRRLRLVQTEADATAALWMRAHPFFSELSHVQIDRLIVSGRALDLERGQHVYDRGDNASRFYLVLEGQVNLALHSSTGEEKIIDLLGPGQLFAEAVVFMEQPTYQMTAIAGCSSQVFGFRHTTYLEILQESPAQGLRVLRHLSNRLHVRIREIEGFTLESATHRLVRLLSARLPSPCTGPTVIELNESRQELASYLSMKPETLSRALRALVEAGAVAVRGRSVVVASREALLAQLHGQVV